MNNEQKTCMKVIAVNVKMVRVSCFTFFSIREFVEFDNVLHDESIIVYKTIFLSYFG